MNVRVENERFVFDKPQLLPQSVYNSERAQSIHHIKWILNHAVGNSDFEADPPVFVGESGNVVISPSVIAGLVGGDTYLAVTQSILNGNGTNASSSLAKHAYVLSILAGSSIYPMEESSNGGSLVVTAELLAQAAPFRISSHIAVIESIMMAYCMKLAPVDKVIDVVNSFVVKRSKELPFDVEDGLIFWINFVLRSFRNKNEETASMEEVFDVLEVCDGLVLASVLSYFCPSMIPCECLAFSDEDDPSLSNCVYNMQIVKHWCQISEGPKFLMDIEDVLYPSQRTKHAIMVLLSEMFHYLCVQPLPCVEVFPDAEAPTGKEAVNTQENSKDVEENEKPQFSVVQSELSPRRSARGSPSKTSSRVRSSSPDLEESIDIAALQNLRNTEHSTPAPDNGPRNSLNQTFTQLDESDAEIIAQPLGQLDSGLPADNPDQPEDDPDLPEDDPDLPEDNPDLPEENPDLPKDNADLPEDNPDLPKDNPDLPEDNPDLPDEDTPTVVTPRASLLQDDTGEKSQEETLRAPQELEEEYRTPDISDEEETPRNIPDSLNNSPVKSHPVSPVKCQRLTEAGINNQLANAVKTEALVDTVAGRFSPQTPRREAAKRGSMTKRQSASRPPMTGLMSARNPANSGTYNVRPHRESHRVSAEKVFQRNDEYHEEENEDPPVDVIHYGFVRPQKNQRNPASKHKRHTHLYEEPITHSDSPVDSEDDYREPMMSVKAQLEMKRREIEKSRAREEYELRKHRQKASEAAFFKVIQPQYEERPQGRYHRRPRDDPRRLSGGENRRLSGDERNFGLYSTRSEIAPPQYNTMSIQTSFDGPLPQNAQPSFREDLKRTNSLDRSASGGDLRDTMSPRSQMSQNSVRRSGSTYEMRDQQKELERQMLIQENIQLNQQLNLLKSQFANELASTASPTSASPLNPLLLQQQIQQLQWQQAQLLSHTQPSPFLGGLVSPAAAGGIPMMPYSPHTSVYPSNNSQASGANTVRHSQTLDHNFHNTNRSEEAEAAGSTVPVDTRPLLENNTAQPEAPLSSDAASDSDDHMLSVSGRKTDEYSTRIIHKPSAFTVPVDSAGSDSDCSPSKPGQEPRAPGKAGDHGEKTDTPRPKSTGFTLIIGPDGTQQQVSDFEKKRQKLLRKREHENRNRKQLVQSAKEQSKEEKRKLALEQREKKEEERQKRERVLAEHQRSKQASESCAVNYGPGPQPNGNPKPPRPKAKVAPRLKTNLHDTPNDSVDSGRETRQNLDDDGKSEAGAPATGHNSSAGGLKLYVKPATRSNKQIIINAITQCVFPGAVNVEHKQKILAEISARDVEEKNLLLLFRDHNMKYRGLYGYDPETGVISKLTGTGPALVREDMIEDIYKYNSGSKSFTNIPSKTMSVSVDGFTIKNHLWKASKR